LLTGVIAPLARLTVDLVAAPLRRANRLHAGGAARAARWPDAESLQGVDEAGHAHERSRQLATAAQEHTNRQQDGLVLVTAAYTGLRAGELWALRKEDLVLAPTEDARVLVRRTLSTANGKLEFRPTTKTDRPRTVSLPAFLTRQLATHVRQLQPADLVFASLGGGGGRKAGERTPVRHELWMQRVFKPAVKAALPTKPDLRFHDLRHTCASLLIANGASIMLVSQRLGHASTRMTLDRYSWMYPSEEAAMAVALNAVWEAAPAPAPADLEARRTRRAN